MREFLRDRRLWGMVIGNALVMTVYTLWTNWTTLYFVEQHHLTEIQANRQFAFVVSHRRNEQFIVDLNFDRPKPWHDFTPQGFTVDNVAAFHRNDLAFGDIGFGK